MGYQPEWRDGQVVSEGERASSDRYDPIYHILSQIDGPFSVLDFGANAGYFSQRIAADFPHASITAVDSYSDINRVASDQIQVINRRMGASEIRAMPRFDVVLALSVLHHMKDWRESLVWLEACRRFLIAEMPHPDEKWMRSAAARHELKPMHDIVSKRANMMLGDFERVGRDGSVHRRPMFAVNGTIRTITGTIFSGSGTCSRKLKPNLHAAGIDKELGYQPFPGSLNLRCEYNVDLGKPVINWPGRVKPGGRSRPYWFWPAWVGDHACHAMVPGPRGHGPDSIELVSPVSIRNRFGYIDGDQLTVDIMLGGK